MDHFRILAFVVVAIPVISIFTTACSLSTPLKDANSVNATATESQAIDLPPTSQPADKTSLSFNLQPNHTPISGTHLHHHSNLHSYPHIYPNPNACEYLHSHLYLHLCRLARHGIGAVQLQVWARCSLPLQVRTLPGE